MDSQQTPLHHVTPEELPTLPPETTALAIPDLTDETAHELLRFSGLEAINLSRSWTSDATVEILCALPNLRWIDLSHNKDITQAAIIRLTELPLRGLHLRNVDHMNYACVDAILNCTELEELDIGYAPSRPEQLLAVGRLTRLRVLGLCRQLGRRDRSADQAVISSLAGLPELEKLDLSSPGTFTTAMLSPLADARSLHTLDLSSMELDDDAPAMLAALPSLRDLVLEECQLPHPARFADLAVSATLRCINLSLTDLAAEALAALAHSPILSTLSISHCTKLGARDVDVLGRAPALQVLDLSGLDIDDATLLAFDESRLRELSIHYCRHLTPGGVQRFISHNPACVVDSEDHLKVATSAVKSEHRLDYVDGPRGHTAAASGSLVAADRYDGRVWLWRDGRLVTPTPLRSSSEVSTLALDTTSGLMGAGYKTGIVWDVTGEEPRLVAKLKPHPRAITAMAFAPDATLSLTGTGQHISPPDNCLRIWDLETSKRLHKIQLPDVCHDIAVARNAPLAAAFSGGTVTLFNYRTGEASPDTFLGDTGCFDHSGRLWLSRPGELVFVDLITGAELRTLETFDTNTELPLLTVRAAHGEMIPNATSMARKCAPDRLVVDPDGRPFILARSSTRALLWCPDWACIIEEVTGAWISDDATGLVTHSYSEDDKGLLSWSMAAIQEEVC